jgi:predicted  nucleic acid-binding Zn-ribbon protein
LGAAPEKPKEEAVSAPTPSLESLIKIESLAKDLKKSQKENEKLKWDLETMNKNYEKMKIQLQESNNKLAQLEKLTNEESGQISKVLEEKEKYLSEKVYYLQVNSS